MRMGSILLVAALSAGGVRVAAAATWAKPGDVAGFGHAQISLIHAVALAEAKLGGKPRALDGRFEGAAGRYRITLAAKDQAVVAQVPAGMQESVTLGKPGPLDAAAHAALTALGPKDLTDAIAAAEELGGGAIDAGPSEQAGKPVERIDIVVDGKLRTVLVDPASDKVVSGGGAPAAASAPAQPAGK